MQGINPLTMKCIYETPCGWCSKWDKKCDNKIGRTNDNGLVLTPIYNNGKSYGLKKEN
jgi:hypothetical protein